MINLTYLSLVIPKAPYILDSRIKRGKGFAFKKYKLKVFISIQYGIGWKYLFQYRVFIRIKITMYTNIYITRGTIDNAARLEK